MTTIRIVSLSVFFAMAAVLGAYGLGMAAQEQVTSAASAGQLSGKISEVDSMQNRLKLKTGLFGSADIAVNDQTAILSSDDERLRLSQLKPGDKVRVEYANEDGLKMARTITVEKQDQSRS